MREKNYFAWILLAAVLLVLLNLPLSFSRAVKSAVREALAPLNALITGTAGRLHEAFTTVRGFGGLVKENREMAEELVHLRNEARLLRDYERQNEQLREQLGFLARTRRQAVAGEIIARDISGWWQTVRLNKGAADGLQPGQAVMTADGLAGRTVDVSMHTADVLLISDPNCRVSAQVVRTGAFGVLYGQGTRWNGQVVCRMDFINRNLPVRPGDEIVTSGLGGVYPPGLLIGYVEEAEADESGLYQSAAVVPRADLGMMAYVFVLAADTDELDLHWKERRRSVEENGVQP